MILGDDQEQEPTLLPSASQRSREKRFVIAFDHEGATHHSHFSLLILAFTYSTFQTVILFDIILHNLSIFEICVFRVENLPRAHLEYLDQN